MLYTEVFIIANIQITIKMFLEIKISMLYWRDYDNSGWVIAGFHCSLRKMNGWGRKECKYDREIRGRKQWSVKGMELEKGKKEGKGKMGETEEQACKRERACV